MTTHDQRNTTANKQTTSIPKQLATLTDLPKEAVQAISEAVNPLVADSLTLYVKLKNYHWHLAGPHFRDYHLMFDEMAEQALNSVDKLAERVRRIGGTTLRSIGHVSQLQTISDDNEPYVETRMMLRRLVEDHNQIAQHQRVAIEVCDQHRDSVTSNVLQEILDQTEKRKWFLYEMLQNDGTSDALK